jgi:pilus assembly protein FimV
MSSNFKKRAAVAAVASCLAVTPWFAEAAGLGKITVLSGLGQPLRAELEVNATREEVTGMTARLAPQDAFRQAGIDYASALLDLRFSVEKRGNGQSVIKVSSSKPVNEPFLDFLVELNWPAGRLVREYTFLLDPPDEFAGKSASRPVSVVDAKIIETVPGGGGEPAPRRAAAPKPVPSAPKQVAAPKPTPSGDTHLVRQGETLRKIAVETKPEGVSLEQMLVGLYRSNPDAFIGNNINRLKSGAILSIPDKSSAEAVSQADARQVYVAQANDWNAYRQKLATATAQAPAKADGGAQASAGKIIPKVEDKAAPAESAKDQVKISRTEMAAQAAAAAKASEDAVAKDKALKDAQDRLAQLEKNLGELQKLVDTKSQKLAELQQQATVKKEEPKVAPAPVVPAKPVEAVNPVEVAKVPEVAKPEPAKPAPPVEAAKPPEPPKPEVAPEVKPPPPKKVILPPEPEPEPSFLEENLMPLAGGGGILALLAGYFLYKRRRNVGPAETTAAPGPSSLGPNSVFRMTGGQSVDTGNTPPQTGDFSQTGPGTIDTDEVDPVAEADVYMAYGRDAQAEEILIEALQKDPQRTAIHAKLLEIYANRKSLKQFETLASELYAQTGGSGPEWAKVAVMGAGLDPENPLYSGHGAAASVFDADATMIVSPDAVKATLAVSAGMLAQTALATPNVDDTYIGMTAEPAAMIEDSLVIPDGPTDIDLGSPEESVTVDDVMSLDFDLGTTNVDPLRPAAPDAVPEPEFVSTIGTGNANALDFDLGVSSVPLTPAPEAPESASDPLDTDIIDFDLGSGASIQAISADEDNGPDFSPEGTMVMPSVDKQGIEFDSNETQVAPENAFGFKPAMTDDLTVDDMVNTFVGGEAQVAPEDDFEAQAALAEDLAMSEMVSTFVGNEVVAAPAKEPEPESFGDFALDMDLAESSATVVNPDILRMAIGDNDEPVPSAVEVKAAPAPVVNDDESLDFDVRLTDSSVLGQPMHVPSYDIGSINLDLSSDEPAPAAASMASDFAQPAAIDVEPAAPSAPEFSAAQREEVSTKLDLAKAYEEMGDLEGARELLQEVSLEGPPDLVEQAREILGRIGE